MMANSSDLPQKPRNLVLITTGLRPVALAFADFPESPVGIVVWDKLAGASQMSRLSFGMRWIWARLRGRPFATLSHLCGKKQLRYAEISSSDPIGLASVLAEWQCDLVVTSGCSMIPMTALDDVPLGGINLHPSMLPNHRGANPFFWQIVDDVPDLGVTVHRLAARADAGDILGSRSCPRPDGLDKNALTSLTEASMGVPLLMECIERLRDDPAHGEPQNIVSPTPYANAIMESELVEQFPLNTLDARRAYNIMCFWKHCPADWLELSGWRSRLKWKATDYSADESTIDSDSKWRTAKGVFVMTLVHRSGRIKLRIGGLVRNSPG